MEDNTLGDNIGIGDIIAIITFLGSIITTIWYFTRKKYRTRIHVRRNAVDFHPYLTQNEVNNYINWYVKPFYQSVSPSIESEIAHSLFVEAQEKLIPKLLKIFRSNNNTHRHFVILAGSGMGKTALLINLKIRYEISKKSKRPYNVLYIPLGSKDCNSKLRDHAQNASHTILLLDSFDEDSSAVHDYDNRMNEIVELTRDYRYVVITCRTQFFNSELDEPSVIRLKSYGEQRDLAFKKFYLSPFSDKQIRRYIRRRFRLNPYKIRQARRIVRNSPNLMARPMLLSNIKILVESGKKISSSIDIYEHLIDFWLKRESGKIKSPLSRKDYEESLYNFSLKLAEKLYENFLSGKDLRINEKAIEVIGSNFRIDLTLMEMKSKSLLNRDPGGLYKFSHKSILEFFLAINTYNNRSKAKFIHNGFTQAHQFYMELVNQNLTIPAISSENLYLNDLGFSLVRFELIRNSNFKSVYSGYYMTALIFGNNKNHFFTLSEHRKTWHKILLFDVVLDDNSQSLLKLAPISFNGGGIFNISNLGRTLNSLYGVQFIKGLIGIVIENMLVSDISDLLECRDNLIYLTLTNSNIKTLIGLEDMNLEFLDLSHNEINSLSVIQDYKSLTHLNLSNNCLQEIEGIKKLNRLEHLDISNNPDIKSITELAELPSLKYLNVSSTNSLSHVVLLRFRLLKILDSENEFNSFNEPLAQLSVLIELLKSGRLNRFLEKVDERHYTIEFNFELFGFFPRAEILFAQYEDSIVPMNFTLSSNNFIVSDHLNLIQDFLNNLKSDLNEFQAKFKSTELLQEVFENARDGLLCYHNRWENFGHDEFYVVLFGAFKDELKLVVNIKNPMDDEILQKLVK